jgi:drug/metabolite transporter (DMT)-like permease
MQYTRSICFPLQAGRITDEGARNRCPAGGATTHSQPSTVRLRDTALEVQGLLLLAAIFLGLNFVAIKIAVVSIPPLLLGAVRFTLGGLLLLVVLPFLEPNSKPAPKFLLTTFGIGLFVCTLFNAALNEGMHLTSASNSALIMATAPVWGMLLAAGFGVESLKSTNIIGAGISLAGVGLLLGGGFEGSRASLVGDVLVLAAAVSFGTYSVLSRAQQRHYPPLTIAAYSTFFGGLTLFLLTPHELARWDWGTVSTGAWVALAYLTIFSTAIAYGIWQWGISRIGADRVLVYLYLVTLVGVVSSIVLLGEGFGLAKLLGTVVLLVGVYFARR